MSDTIETPAVNPAEDARAHNKNLIFAALAEAGIQKLTVGYDGYGDSGQLDDFEAWSTDAAKISLPSSLKLHLVSSRPGKPSIEITLHEAIETLAYDYLGETHPGWENNDGGFGTFVFCVPDRTITLEHNGRYTEVETSSYEF